MRRVWFVIAVSALFLPAQPSTAADMAVKAPRAVSGYTWSGFYVGGNIGGGWSHARWDNTANTTLFGDALPGNNFGSNPNGVIGGLQVGYNFQNGPWVFGLEALFDLSSVQAQHTSTFGAADDQFTTAFRSFLMATGRAGYAWNNWLAYVKGGYALAQVRASVNDGVAPTTGSGGDTQWRSGPTVGGGFEYAFTPQLSVGVEYDYIRLDSGGYQLGGGTGSYAWNVAARDVHLVMAKFNYRFSWAR